MTDIQDGDQIQARLKGEQAGVEQYLVTEFTVTGIDASGLVFGSFLYPAGLDPDLGWQFDLIRRSITLPDVATEIVATLSNGEQASLVGKGDVWVRSDSGRAVDPSEIHDFTPADEVVRLPPTPRPVDAGSPVGQ